MVLMADDTTNGKNWEWAKTTTMSETKTNFKDDEKYAYVSECVCQQNWKM